MTDKVYPRPYPKVWYLQYGFDGRKFHPYDIGCCCTCYPDNHHHEFGFVITPPDVVIRKSVDPFYNKDMEPYV